MSEPRSQVDLYTDGACSGNPGPGAWAALLISGRVEKELSGAEAATTNNRMEMQAVIQGLRALKWPCRVHIYSDSAYVVNAFNQAWIRSWERRGWKNAAGQDVANADLWQELLEQERRHELYWHKVKGHADDARNNRCDRLAVETLKRFRENQEEGR